MRLPTLPTLLVAAVSLFVPGSSHAQPADDLLLPPQAAAAASRRDVPARRMRKARVNLPALNAPSLRLHLFNDLQPTVTRKKLATPGPDKLVWTGEGDGASAILTVVKGVLTGTVYVDDRAFEITIEPDGHYAVTEIDPGAFPTDDPPMPTRPFEVLGVPDAPVGDEAQIAAPPPATDSLTAGGSVMDVMIVWTQAAENAAGGAAAIQSLALNSVANANLAYTNSGVNAELRLVYSGKLSYTETPSDILRDLTSIETRGDNVADEVHTLRDQYGADVVTLFGEGYRNSGSCGIGELMQTNSTSFAAYAFNVVDRSCALANLSYAHEVGHNQGLHHDPSNSGGYPGVSSYAYGYQDPSGLFRTVLAYGGATRIPYLSSPSALYNGRPTGTASQDNGRALAMTAPTVSAFRSVGSGTGGGTTPVTCTYTVSTTSLSFSASGGNKSVTLTAGSGCAWSTSNGGAAWLGVGPSSGSGAASVTVSVPANTGGARSATITIAGRQVAVSQQAKKTTGKPTRDK